MRILTTLHMNNLTEIKKRTEQKFKKEAYKAPAKLHEHNMKLIKIKVFRKINKVSSTVNSHDKFWGNQL